MEWPSLKTWTIWARVSIAVVIARDHGASTYLPAASQAAGLAFSLALTVVASAVESVAVAAETAAASAAIASLVAVRTKRTKEEGIRLEMAVAARDGQNEKACALEDQTASAMVAMVLPIFERQERFNVVQRCTPRILHTIIHLTSPSLRNRHTALNRYFSSIPETWL